MESCLRPGDTVARLGGDEFTILLHNINDASDAATVAERIHREMAFRFQLGGHDVFTSASIGIALSMPEYSGCKGDMLRDADIAMYRAKGLGRSRFAPIVFGCQAPDSGNAEILAHYGTEEQKKRFLKPLLDNEIVSCFSMTEPQGGADPKVFETTAKLVGDQWVLNGEKWFSSNAHVASFLIVMAITYPEASPYERMSMFIVPKETPGFSILRNMAVGLHEGGEDGKAYAQSLPFLPCCGHSSG